MNKQFRVLTGLSALALMSPSLVFANRTADILVIGSKEQEVRLTGSGHYISRDAVSSEGQGDIMSILAKEVPGTSSYAEDGYGLFPNIAFRGVNSGRSSKVTLMEDGVLAAPGPYAAPAAYYSPQAFRMDGIEVLKGSSQVLYGPMTTGGVINYLSTPFSDKAQTRYKALYGTNNETQLVMSHADRLGKFSYVVELAHRQTDGFKTIDALPAAENFDREQTGHRVLDPMIKLAYDLGDRFDQRFELKLARTEMTAFETYLGLSNEDFDADPYRRYAASRFDRMDTKNERGSLRHFMNFGDSATLITTLYSQNFHRNWYKLNDVKVAGGGFSSPNPNDAAQRDVMTGIDAGELRVRANNRFYESRGVEQNFTKSFDRHELKIGWRFHRDTERRKHWDDVYAQAAGGQVTGITRGTPLSQDNRRAHADAWAVYVQDEMTFGRLSIIPGIRFEKVEFSSENYRTGTPEATGSLTVVNPGIGARYALTSATTLFGGIYKGSALPGPGDVTRAVDPIDKAEASYNFEFGVRSQINPAARIESTLFYTALRDLLALENIGTGATSTSSIGKASTYGIEFKGAYDLGTALNKSFSNPWYLTATWNKAEIGGDYTNAGHISGDKGNSLPYSPDLRFTVGTGLGFNKISFDINGTFNGKMYRTGANLPAEEIKSYFIVDSSVSYAIRPETKLSVMVQNVLDKEYMISRSPYGARSGKPQTILVGLQGTF